MINKISTALIILTIIVVNCFRFWQLDNVPYGFNIDELSGAVTVTCMETEGVDAHLNPHPIFFEQHYGTPKPPVYTYPAVLWVKIFGHTIDHLRAFTVFANVWTILGFFFLARLIAGSSYALLVALIASISPWTWSLSRIAYESTFCVTFIVWGIFFFLRSGQWWNKILAGLLFACAIYVYPPIRLQGPLIIGTLFIFNIKQQKIPKRVLTGFFLAILIPCIPLIQGTFRGNLQERFNGLSIFNNNYLQSIGKSRNFHDLAGIFMNNYALHFSPRYLFISGDSCYLCSTQHFGLLGWLEIAGLISLLFFLIFRSKDILSHKQWLIFLVVNFFLGIVPASLTNAGLPNALRTIGAFPFLCLLSGYGLWLLCQRWPFFLPLTTLLGILFAFFFLRVYFTVYPQESKGWFSFWTKEEALNAKTDEDWLKFMVTYRNQDYDFRYYLMNYHGETCSSSRAIWIKLNMLLSPKS